MITPENEVQESEKPKITGAILCLRISTVLYVLVGVGMGVLFFEVEGETNEGIPEGVFALLSVALVLFSWAFAVVPELAIRGLRKRRRWGWILGIILGGLYTVSALFFLGIPILVSLLKKGAQQYYLPNAN